MVDALVARDAPRTLEDAKSNNTSSVTGINSDWLYRTGMRLDAGHYNSDFVDACRQLEFSGLAMKRLGDVTQSIFIPPRFRRVYVDQDHGTPFLQGTHLPQFKPTDLKFLSRTAHKDLRPWVIHAGWVLVTCSGTIGRVSIALHQWDGWAASQHILRVVPQDDGLCPAGYIYAWLSSPLGQAQFNGVYGSVVDEITSEHVANILIPVPETGEQQIIVKTVNNLAFQAVEARERALEMDALSVSTLSELVSGPETLEA